MRILTCFALLMLMSHLCFADIESGLVGHWNFNEGDGGILEDISGNGNDGTIEGASWAPGLRGGQALYFDGIDDYVIVNSSASLQLTTTASFSIWVNFDGDYYHEHSSHLFSKGATLAALYADYTLKVYDPGLTDTSIYYEVADGSNNPHFFKVEATVEPNSWHHLAAVYDNGNIKIYMDGQKLAEGTTHSPMRASTQPLYIGHRYAAENNGRVKGSIDEFRIYDRALSDNEVNTLYLRAQSIPSLNQGWLIALVLLILTSSLFLWRRKSITNQQ